MHPVKVDTHTIYFRGIRIIDTVISVLLTAGVHNAEHVILTGCSGERQHQSLHFHIMFVYAAGGLSTYYHIDHIRKMIPSTIPMHAIADAG